MGQIEIISPSKTAETFWFSAIETDFLDLYAKQQKKIQCEKKTTK